MGVRAVIGTQWGDEGKGGIVDYLAQDADMVIRFSGGNNAGHTVINEQGEFKLHIVPVGIFNPKTTCIIGTGTVVHLETLVDELRELHERGISADNLFISRKAHLVMPWHIWQDEAEEAQRNHQDKIGTTKRGMGPVFADKAARLGLRAGDLLDFDAFEKKFHEIYNEKMRVLSGVYGDFTFVRPYPGQILERYKTLLEDVRDFIVDTESLAWDALDKGQNILLEGAQAVLLGIDHGTYPYVTSSNCGIAQAAEGSGIPPNMINEVIGVVKAYTTRVGAGAFPTKAQDKDDERLREQGKEYGATTGRPRMCGWVDLPLLEYAARLNGFTSIVITKLDVLSDFDRIPFGKGYHCEKHGDSCTNGLCGLEGQKARYGSAKGWKVNIENTRHWDELPDLAQRYVRRIEKAMRCPAQLISVGPERDQIIIRT